MKVTYDVSGDIPETANAPVGWYRGKVKSVEQRTSNSGNEMVEVHIQLTHDEGGKKITEDAFWPVRVYLMIEDDRPYAKRGIRDFVSALGLGLKGELTDKKLIGKPLSVKLKADTDQDGEYQPRVAKLLKPGEQSDNGAGPSAAADDDEPVTDATAAEPDEDEDEDGIDLEALDRAGLKRLIKEEGLEIKVLKSKSDADLRTEIADAMGAEEEDEDEDEDEDGDEAPDDNYAEMSLPDLKAEFKERELEAEALKGKKGAALKVALVEALREDDASPF